MPKLVKKVGDSKYIVPVILDKNKYPRISIPKELAERLELHREPFVILELKEDSIVIKKAKVVVE